MSKNILIISPEVLKARTTLHTNVDNKMLYPEIKAAQDMYIRPLLGDNLFNKILSDIDTNALTGNYKILVDSYLIDCLCNYVLSEMPESANYQFTNKGVVTKTGEGDNSPTMSDMYSIVRKYRNRAEMYAEQAKKHLKVNAKDYAELNDTCCDNGQETFSIPIYLGDNC